MHRADSAVNVDTLLREGAALRALVRRLLDDAAADDVVQDTYVAALRAPAPSGAMGAWLGGIACKLAALSRRRAARRNARELLVASRTGAVPSAAEAAATAEWTQRIATAVAELPEAQRTVVVLRFWHDLPPRAIASRLREPLNTVSSRLRRALVQLRERLDAQGERRGAWLAPLASFVGITTMATKGNVVVAAGVLAALGWVVWPVERSAGPVTPAWDAPPARTVAADDAPSPRVPAATATEAATATMSGRCVTDAGAPLAGCRVGLVVTRSRDGERPQPTMTTTDADGRFRLGPVPAGAAYSLACITMHLTCVERRWEPPAGDTDLGDIVLPAGARLVGMVRDAAGNGVGGVLLGLELVAPEAAGEGFAPISRLAARSRGDGVLEPLGGALVPGNWRLDLSSAEHVLRSAPQFTVAPGQQKVELDVRVARLDEQPVIAGVVCDEGGVPAARLTLVATDGSTVRTGADGAFTLHRRDLGPPSVRFALAPNEPCSLVAPDHEYPWGSTGQRVVVRRPAGVWLHVVRADTGEPVTEYGVWLVPAANGQWSSGLQDDGHHEEGRVRLTNVRAGRYRVIVQPADPTLMPSEGVDAELAGDAALRIEIERARALLVDVRTAAGEPVAGSAVELFRQEGDGELRPGMIGSPKHAFLTFKHPAAFPVLASARTDADGRAVVPAPRRGRLGLRVQGAHVPTIEHPLRAVGDDDPIVLVVQRGATLRGTLSPANLLPALAPSTMALRSSALGDPVTAARPWPTVQLRELGGARRVFPMRVTMTQPAEPVGDDGSFRIAGIPPGDWQVELQCGVGDGWYSPKLGTVNALADGEVRTVAFDVAALAPAELRATVLLDGAPAANGEVHFGNGWFSTDARGRVVARVLPGERRLCFAAPGSDVAARVYADEPIHLAPGAVIERTIQLSRRRLMVRVRRADGSPAAGETFGITWLGDVRADDRGLLVLDPAPPWELTLHPPTADVLAGRQKNRRLGGPVRVPLDRREATLEVRLIE